MMVSRYAALCATVAALHGAAALGAPPKKKVTPAAKPVMAVVKSVAAVLAPKPLHPAPHWAVAFSPDGNTIAIGTYRKVLRFDAQTGIKTSEWTVSSDAVRALAFSPDGTKIALGTGVPAQSGSIVIVNAQTGQVLRTVKGHDDTVESVAWKNDGEVLSASDDEKVGLFETATGKKEASLSEHTGRALSVLAFGQTDGDASGGNIFVTGGADKTVKVWDGQVRRVVVNFDQSPGAVWSLAALSRSQGRFAAGCDDGKIRVFATRLDGAKPANANEPQGRTGFLAQTLSGHEGAVYAVASSTDGSLVSGGADKKVILWASGGNKKREWTEAQGDIWSVAFSPSGSQIAASSEDGQTRVYDTKTGTLLFTLGGGATVVPAAPVPLPAPPTPPSKLIGK